MKTIATVTRIKQINSSHKDQNNQNWKEIQPEKIVRSEPIIRFPGLPATTAPGRKKNKKKRKLIYRLV